VEENGVVKWLEEMLRTEAQAKGLEVTTRWNLSHSRTRTHTHTHVPKVTETNHGRKACVLTAQPNVLNKGDRETTAAACTLQCQLLPCACIRLHHTRKAKVPISELN
jgi:hypothetical protein